MRLLVFVSAMITFLASFAMKHVQPTVWSAIRQQCVRFARRDSMANHVRTAVGLPVSTIPVTLTEDARVLRNTLTSNIATETLDN